MTQPDWPAWHCPEHREPLVAEGDSLSCPRGDSFPIRGGIPRFVSGKNYADAFGAQWNRYRLSQLDSHTGSPISRDRLRRVMGDELWGSLEGKHVVEVGAGAGRFTEVLLEEGAFVTAVDLSDAIDANEKTFAGHERRRAAQADALKLPFAPQQFDVVLCLGVVQSTPNSEETTARLYEHVRPGGWLVIDHYTWEAGWLVSLSPLVRLWLKRTSRERGIRVTERLVDTLLPLHRRAGRVGRKVLDRVSPVMSYYDDYPQLSDELQREWAYVDTHDSLTDWFKWFRTRGQIESALRELGLEGIWTERGGNGVEARGRRPGGAALGSESQQTAAAPV